MGRLASVHPPIILDFATAIVAEGKVLVAQKGGKPIPPGSLIEPDGTQSHDPLTLYGEVEPGRSPNARKGKGAIRAMGEHKGSGLSFICEILAGALTGSGCAGPGQPALGNGMLSIYLSMDYFDSDQHFAAEARSYIEFFKSSPAAETDGEVLLPGDMEIRTREQRLAEGVPLTDDTWNSILAAAERAGLEQKKIDTILMM